MPGATNVIDSGQVERRDEGKPFETDHCSRARLAARSPGHRVDEKLS